MPPSWKLPYPPPSPVWKILDPPLLLNEAGKEYIALPDVDVSIPLIVVLISDFLFRKKRGLEIAEVMEFPWLSEHNNTRCSPKSTFFQRGNENLQLSKIYIVLVMAPWHKSCITLQKNS